MNDMTDEQLLQTAKELLTDYLVLLGSVGEYLDALDCRRRLDGNEHPDVRESILARLDSAEEALRKGIE